MSFEQIQGQLGELSGLVLEAYRSALQTAELVEVRALTLALSTLSGSTNASAEQIVAFLQQASDGTAVNRQGS